VPPLGQTRVTSWLKDCGTSMTEDVDWPNAWKGGRLTGRDAVRDYWIDQSTAIDPRVQPLAVEPRADASVAVSARQTVRTGDGAVVSDQEVIHVYALRGRLVARMHVEKRASTPAGSARLI
jgi:hypothetical protein